MNLIGATNGRNRRTAVAAGRVDDGPLPDHIAGAQPWRRDRIFVPFMSDRTVALVHRFVSRALAADFPRRLILTQALVGDVAE